MKEISLVKNELILDDQTTIKENNIQNGDLIGVRFYRIVNLGETAKWDKPTDN